MLRFGEGRRGDLDAEKSVPRKKKKKNAKPASIVPWQHQTYECIYIHNNIIEVIELEEIALFSYQIERYKLSEM